MRNENHRSPIGINGGGNKRDMAKVDMICRLIKNKKPWTFKHETRESHEPFLPFGKGAYLSANGDSVNEKSRRNASHAFFVFLVHRGHQRFVSRIFKIKR